MLDHTDTPVWTNADPLTVGEIANALRVSKMTVYRLIRDGHLTGARVGRSIRVHREDLARYMENAVQAGPIGSEAQP